MKQTTKITEQLENYLLQDDVRLLQCDDSIKSMDKFWNCQSIDTIMHSYHQILNIFNLLLATSAIKR